MKVHIVVVRAFGTYRKADTITDIATISEVLAGENALNVVRVVSQGN